MYAETQATAAESVKQKREWVSGRRVSDRRDLRWGWTRTDTQLQAEAARLGGVSFSTVFGIVVSTFEAFRRSCKGCLEVCLRTFGKGWVGQTLGWAGDRAEL